MKSVNIHSRLVNNELNDQSMSSRFQSTLLMVSTAVVRSFVHPRVDGTILFSVLERRQVGKAQITTRHEVPMNTEIAFFSRVQQERESGTFCMNSHSISAVCQQTISSCFIFPKFISLSEYFMQFSLSVPFSTLTFWLCFCLHWILFKVCTEFIIWFAKGIRTVSWSHGLAMKLRCICLNGFSFPATEFLIINDSDLGFIGGGGGPRKQLISFRLDDWIPDMKKR